MLRPGRVRDRPEQIEDRPNSDLAADRASESHRGVERRRVHEADTDPFDRLGHLLRRKLDLDTQPLQHVGRPTTAGRRPVAVLGDLDACPGHDERCRRRDVERVCAVAAGSAGVDDRPDVIERDMNGLRTHHLGEPGQFLVRLAAHPQPHQKRSDLGWRRLAVHDDLHRAPGFVARQCLPLDDRLNLWLQHGSTSPSIRSG